jgi:alpha-D-xyloside xylohydrolase
MPIYVRAGSIVPIGPDEEWSDQKPADPIELRIYPGADGDFILYEDENDTYNYERGVYSTIPIHWDDAKQALTIGERKGSFPGMLTDRVFKLIVVREKHGVGVESEATADKTIRYSGMPVSASR